MTANEVKRDTSVEPFKPFRFLDLPSELRNNVYELALAETPKIDYARLRVYRYWKKYSSDSLPPPMPSLAPQKSCLSLTQVCRQVRKELRPTYLRITELHITIKDVTSYISTFYPSSLNNANTADLGNIVIVLLPPTKYRITVDIISAIDIYCTHPDIRVRFDWPNLASNQESLLQLIARMLNSNVFSSTRRAAWKNAIDNDLEEILINPYRIHWPFHGFSIILVWKTNHEQEWARKLLVGGYSRRTDSETLREYVNELLDQPVVGSKGIMVREGRVSVYYATPT